MLLGCLALHFCALYQGAGNFVKSQIGNILGFMVRIVSVATIQFGHCSMQASLDNTQMSGYDSIPIQLYLWTLKSEFHIVNICNETLLFSTIKTC